MADSRKNLGQKKVGASDSDAGGLAAFETGIIGSAVITVMNTERISIQRISPCVDSGAAADHDRHPAKSTLGQYVTVEATIFMDGHGMARCARGVAGTVCCP